MKYITLLRALLILALAMPVPLSVSPPPVPMPPVPLPRVSILAALSAREVYASNAIGALVRSLPSDTAVTRSGYVMIIDEGEQTRTERLYLDGVLIRRTRFETVGRIKTESIYLSGALTERNTYDPTERLLSAATYDDEGSPSGVTRYTYDSNQVIAMRFDGNDDLLFEELRRIDQNGRIVAIERSYATGREERVEFIFLDRHLLREFHRLDDLTVILSYDSNGRLSREEHRLADVLQREIAYSYDARVEDRVPNTISRTEIIDGVARRSEIENDDQGRAVMQLTYEDDILVEEESFEYQNGRLLSSRLRRTGSTSQQQFIYDEEGVVREEQWYDNGVLVRTVAIEDATKNTQTEVRYINGQPYARVYFENGVRVREEFVADDAITRERVLE